MCSKLCRANQIKIADILLDDVFITKDIFLERAKVLTWKARIARAELERVEQEGVEKARVEQARDEKARAEEECIRHLSERISNLVIYLLA